MFIKKKYHLKHINIFNNEKGMALIATIIFVSILVSFGVAILALTNNDSKLSTLHRESNRAFYIAEKGIEKALYNLNEDDNYPMTSENGLIAWRPDKNSPYSFESTAEEYFLVTIENIGESEDAEERIKITSTGIVDKEKFNSAQRKIEVIAKKDHFEYAKYKYAILTDKLVYGRQSPIIEGDIHSNDDISISGIESGKLDYDGVATCSGDVNDITEENTFVPKVTLPTINYDTLKEIAAGEGNDHIISGPLTLDNNDPTRTWTGLHYIMGNLYLKNSASINITNGAIIVEGEVIIFKDASITISKPEDLEDPFYEKIYSPLAIVATGQIELKNDSTSVNGVVQSIQKDGSYTPDNKIIVKENAEIFGSAIASKVEIKNDGSIIYDGEKMSHVMEIGDYFYKKTSWQEVYN